MHAQVLNLNPSETANIDTCNAKLLTFLMEISGKHIPQGANFTNLIFKRRQSSTNNPHANKTSYKNPNTGLQVDNN